MFVRVKRSARNGRSYEYLQIVRSVRQGQAVRQQVLGTLGRRDELLASGELDQLLVSLGAFSEKLAVVERVRTAGLGARSARAWGPALVFGRLWETQGLPALLADLARERKFQFDIERACFALALQRLCAPGSDLAGSRWIETVQAEGFDRLALQHFYRTTGFLYDVRLELEQRLFLRDRDLFTQSLDLDFLDTTSVYVYRDTETEWRKRGYSRDRRGDLPQLVLCVVVDANSWPIAWEVFPGNTADPVALHAVVTRLRERFAIRRVVVVADRGMISRKTIDFLTQDEEAPFEYVLGCRMRRHKEVSEDVLSRAGRYQKVDDSLEVKDVSVGPRRYVVCRNETEARKDAAVRQALIEKLEHTLAEHGPKAVIGNKGFARFVKVVKHGISIDQQAIEKDARLDGKFVLTTNTDMPADEVAVTYKNLWRVERTFREEKSTLAVRPIFHHRDDTSIGHIVASFLALRLEVDLQRRLEERKVTTSWPDILRDLHRVQAVTLDLDGIRYRLRTDLVGSAFEAFAAAGVRPPSPVSSLGPAPPDEQPEELESVVPNS
jgi:hypothetical protein